ncbi:unnamed protein product [Schistosoma curassoni]|nr:unnamed protein product [Schistosoma curassoni]
MFGAFLSSYQSYVGYSYSSSRPPYIRGDAFQFLNASREFLEFDRTEYVVTTSLLIQVVSRQLVSSNSWLSAFCISAC